MSLMARQRLVWSRMSMAKRQRRRLRRVSLRKRLHEAKDLMVWIATTMKKTTKTTPRYRMVALAIDRHRRPAVTGVQVSADCAVGAVLKASQAVKLPSKRGLGGARAGLSRSHSRPRVR